MSGVQFDDPNREAVGLDPVWVEGDGGTAGAPPEGLDAMTKAELLDHAHGLGLDDVSDSDTKAEIRQRIDEAGQA
jgi:hypothetical protein